MRVEKRYSSASACVTMPWMVAGPSEGVGEKVLREGTHELVALRAAQHVLEPDRPGKGGPVRELARGIDVGLVLGVAPRPDGVVVLQGEARRIEARMAGRANRICPMPLEFLADGQSAAHHGKGVEIGNIRQRRRQFLSEHHL